MASGPHAGTFTALSALALPGPRHSFVAKTESVVSGPHTGTFTALSAMALPGMRRSFTAKTAAAVSVARGGVAMPYIIRPDHRWLRDRIDRDVMDIIKIIAANEDILN